jgi:hypothetical protein
MYSAPSVLHSGHIGPDIYLSLSKWSNASLVLDSAICTGCPASLCPFSVLILHEIKTLSDVPGVGIVDTPPHKPFYPGRDVLSTTIPGDIRAPSDCICSTPVRRGSPAVARQNDSLRSEQIDIGWTSGSSWAKAKSHAREVYAVVVRRDAPQHWTHSHGQVPAVTPGK